MFRKARRHHHDANHHPAAGASPTATSQTAADQAAAHKGDLLQLVTFHIADEEFGVDILAVQEIIRPIQITMVPHAAAYIEGVINLRGKVIPVINMRTRFNLPPVERDSRTRIVVMEFDQKIVGFLVDGVSKCCAFPPPRWRPRPRGLRRGLGIHQGRGQAGRPAADSA